MDRITMPHEQWRRQGDYVIQSNYFGSYCVVVIIVVVWQAPSSSFGENFAHRSAYLGSNSSANYLGSNYYCGSNCATVHLFLGWLCEGR